MSRMGMQNAPPQDSRKDVASTFKKKNGGFPPTHPARVMLVLVRNVTLHFLVVGINISKIGGKGIDTQNSHV